MQIQTYSSNISLVQQITEILASRVAPTPSANIIRNEILRYYAIRRDITKVPSGMLEKDEDGFRGERDTLHSHLV